MDTFEYLALLDHVWSRQQEEAAGDVVGYRTLWWQEYRGDDSLTLNEMEKKLGRGPAFAEPRIPPLVRHVGAGAAGVAYD